VLTRLLSMHPAHHPEQLKSPNARAANTTTEARGVIARV